MANMDKPMWLRETSRGDYYNRAYKAIIVPTMVDDYIVVPTTVDYYIVVPTTVDGYIDTNPTKLGVPLCGYKSTAVRYIVNPTKLGVPVCG